MLIKRAFDLCFALIGIVVLSPLFILISFLIVIDSRGKIFFVQHRIGLNHTDFILCKFRTMYVHKNDYELLTIGFHDSRVTRIGYWLRKYKLDELPQLFNIIIGRMSFVGPRPEVSKYVNMYTNTQQRVLTVKPGITDWASIKYFNENEILAKAENPELMYINKIMPSKILLNLNYIDNHNFWIDIKIIYQTFRKIFNQQPI